MDNASPEKVVRCCGLPNRICLFVKNKCAAQVLCGCSPWLPWRTRLLRLRMWGALIAYFSPLPGFTKAQSFPIIRTADENANTLSTTREDINYPNVKLDHEKSPFTDGFLGLMFFTLVWGLFIPFDSMWTHFYFFSNWSNCKLVWNARSSILQFWISLSFTSITDGHCLPSFHKAECESMSLNEVSQGLHVALCSSSPLGPSSRSFHEYSWSGVGIMFLHYKKCMMQWSYRKHKQGYSLLLAGNALFFFFWGDDFHWRPLQDQQTFPAFILHKHIHGFIWKVSKVNWG